ncbi:MAG: serine O-acetyltransferase [Christensenellaceae bacterium]|jgi:serine O-acetyltransferase|nr:serine O-acetyltransferase [Christensenellaceae bacterium]
MIENFLKNREDTKDFLLHAFKTSPKIQKDIKKDLLFLFNNDPAAKDIQDVSCYTSAFAVAAYRVAHEQKDELWARKISEYAKSVTGVDIHPKARIGVPFAIDHGVGTVVGETAVIGKNCLLYHGVTLGAKHLKDRDQVGEDRHPKLGNNVIIYSNTTILGNLQIPDGIIIGANKFIKNQTEVDDLLTRQNNKRIL